MTLHDEIAEPPEVAARFLVAQAEPIKAIAASLRERWVGQVVIAARGTSDHAALSLVGGPGRCSRRSCRAGGDT